MTALAGSDTQWQELKKKMIAERRWSTLFYD